MDLLTFAKEAMGRRINLLYRICMRHLRQEMKPLGIGAGDFPFLGILFFMPGLSQDELSKHMHVDKSYTARAVAKLEAAGFVERRPDPEEHRVKRVFTTPQAMAMEAQFFNILKNWNQVLIKDIDPDDLATIQKGLDKMMDNAMMALDGEILPPYPK